MYLDLNQEINVYTIPRCGQYCYCIKKVAWWFLWLLCFLVWTKKHLTRWLEENFAISIQSDHSRLAGFLWLLSNPTGANEWKVNTDEPSRRQVNLAPHPSLLSMSKIWTSMRFKLLKASGCPDTHAHTHTPKVQLLFCHWHHIKENQEQMLIASWLNSLLLPSQVSCHKLLTDCWHSFPNFFWIPIPSFRKNPHRPRGFLHAGAKDLRLSHWADWPVARESFYTWTWTRLSPRYLPGKAHLQLPPG